MRPVREVLARRTGVAAATALMESAAEDLGSGGLDEAYGDALESWLAVGGADLDERLPLVAADLGLSVDLDLPVSALSGGQAARVGLAALLLSRYDLYLLDEPTNDLDIDGLDRLEEFVDGLAAGVVVVSHDREFLSRTVTSVVEIDRSLQRIAVYGGGYDAYLDERSVARRAGARGVRRVRGAQGFAGVARPAAARVDGEGRQERPPQVHATTTRSAASSAAEASEKQAAKARQTERMIERLDTVEEPRKEWRLQLSLAEAPRSGRGGRHTARGVRLPGLVHVGAPRSAGRPARPDRRHRTQRRRQVDPARCPARVGCPSTPAASRSGRASWSARWTRRARLFVGDASAR